MDQQLKKIQKTELGILNVVDDFCKKNNIQYSLTYGTLIGAIRHRGFIPWDDDIDLMMLREQYDKFISLWIQNPPVGYFLQTDVTDPPYGNNFLKIRKNGTTFIQSEQEKNCHYHTGFFIDVFPVDRVAPDGLKRKTQLFACQLNMLMTRNHVSREKSSVVERILLGLPKSWKKIIKDASYRYKIKWNSNDDFPLFWNGTMYGIHNFFIHDLFDEMIEVPFEGRNYPAYREYDRFLTDYFGDYMRLPPEKERRTHHPLIVNFEKEYHEGVRGMQNA